MALPGIRALRKLMKDSGGTVSQMAKEADVSRQTIYNWLDHYNAWDDLESSRANIVYMAETTVYESVAEGDLDTSKWVLERKGRLRGWNKQVEISGVLGQMNLSAEQMAILEAAGYNVSEVVQQFISMLQATELESA
jgi:hypothetical protein